MARCKWCNTEIGDNKVCPQCKANQDGNISGSNVEYVSPFERYENNGSPNRVRTANKKNVGNDNRIASLIKTCTIILLVLGGIGGFVIMLDTGFVGLVALVVLAVSALFCLGFAEIIQLLQDIKDRL